MKRTVALLTVLLLCPLTGSVFSQDERPNNKQEEWESLIKGKNLEDWEIHTDDDPDKVDIKLVDGEIHLDSRGANVWFSHKKIFKDFELRLEVKLPAKKNNSGILIRGQDTGGKPKGFQCEVDGYRSGMINSMGIGFVWPTSKRERENYKAESFRPREWNKFRIRMVDNRIQVWINGKKTADYRSDRFKEGFVSLQNHGYGDVCKFRRVRAREIHR